MAVNTTGQYIQSIGRRKTSTASVRIFEGGEPNMINDRKLEEIYTMPTDKHRLMLPFKVTENLGKFYFTAKVNGGGKYSQLEAVRHGIARALVKWNEELRSDLKKHKLLTRDPRMVERKKAGLKKARKAPQFSKR